MKKRELQILAGCMAVTLVLGTIHSFSVFLIPLETLLTATRAAVSMLYSVALVFLTLAVLWGYRIYSAANPAWLVLFACTAAATALLIAAQSTSWLMWMLCYSVAFGLANGLGYGFVLQLSGAELGEKAGLGMAMVTAAYAVGSIVASLILPAILTNYGLVSAVNALAVSIAAGGIIAAGLLYFSNSHYNRTNDTAQISTDSTRMKAIVWWWLAYGCSVFAGLMAIGHAAGIIHLLEGDYSTATRGAVFIGVGSALGGFLTGLRISPQNLKQFITALPILSAVVLILLTMAATSTVAIALLSVVGFSYGALIALYPYAIRLHFGAQQSAKIYGQIFTAWGVAGLAGPVSAGWLYDRFSAYTVALVIAASLAVLSTLVFYRCCRFQNHGTAT